jgi:LacI family transcriptional regulator
MGGEDLTGLVETIPAGPVTARASSEALHIDDPAIAQAVRRVRRMACEPVGIDEMLEEVPVSRRTVEMGFNRYLGRTIHEEILRVRIQRARRMLRLTDLPIVDIGVRCGFNSRSRFYECFAEAMGVSPGEYRKRRTELT